MNNSNPSPAAQQAEQIISICTHTKRSDASVCIFCLTKSLAQIQATAELRGRIAGLREAAEYVEDHCVMDATELRRRATTLEASPDAP